MYNCREAKPTSLWMFFFVMNTSIKVQKLILGQTMLHDTETTSHDAKQDYKYKFQKLLEAEFTLYDRSQMLFKKSVLKNFKRPATWLKQRLTLVFSYEFWEIFKNTFFS